MQFFQLTIAALTLFLTQTIARPSVETLTTRKDLSVLPDGLYSITRLPNGTFTEATLLATEDSIAARSPMPSMKPRELPSPRVHCKSQNINNDDFRKARDWLNRWCNVDGNWVDGNTFTWFTSGSAQAYICTYTGNKQPCHEGEFNDVNELVDTSCGESTAGWVNIDTVSFRLNVIFWCFQERELTLIVVEEGLWTGQCGYSSMLLISNRALW
jgi:hypothetical protein